MSAQGVFRHQLSGDLICQHGVQPAPDIDGDQLGVLVRAASGQFHALAFQVGALRIGLGAD